MKQNYFVFIALIITWLQYGQEDNYMHFSNDDSVVLNSNLILETTEDSSIGIEWIDDLYEEYFEKDEYLEINSESVVLTDVNLNTLASITCPPDVTINCDEDSSSANTGVATGVGTITQASSSSQDPNPNNIGHYYYTITRTWTATDGSGSAICTQVITVVDVINPTASNPATVNVECSSDVPTPDILVVTDEADNCSAGSNITVAHVSDVSDGNSNPEVITRTYSVTDVAGNSINVTQTINVNDVTNPTVTASANVSRTTNSDGAGDCTADIAISNATFGDNCSGSTLAWVMTGAESASGTGQVGTYTFPIGITTITYTVTDGASRTATDAMTVTVTDNENPTVTASANVSRTTSSDGSGNCTAAIAISNATFGDNCTGSTLAWVMTGAESASGSGQVGTYTFPIGITTITYTVTDGASRTATDSMTVTVTDNENPTVNAAANVSRTTSSDGAGDCTADITISNATFGDNCTGSTLAWVMTGAESASGSGQVGTYTFPIGVTTITYTVTDGASRTATDSMTVTVTDNENPTVTAAANVSRTTSSDGAGECTAAIAISNATFNDNCTGSTLAWVMTGAESASGTGQVGTYTFPIGITTITYTVTDGASRTATDSMTVTVTDNENPTVTASANVSRTTSSDGAGNCTAAIAISNATFGDNCTGSTLAWVMTGAESASGNGQVGTYTFPIGITTITYTVTDGASRTATDSMTVTVTDNENPTVNAAANVSRTTSSDGAGDCTAAIAISNATFGDNCTGSALAWVMTGAESASGSGQVGTYTFPIGVTTITYTVTDGASRTATDSMTVTVTDNENPTVNAAANVSRTTSSDGAGDCTAAIAISNATFNDNCTGSTLAWVMTGAESASGNGQVGTYTFPIGITTITYTVTDGASRTATDAMTVTVTDNENPTVTASANVSRTTSFDGSGNCTAAIAISNATFGDNCTGGALAWVMTGAESASGTGQVGTYTFPIGVTTITYTVTDGASRTATDSMTVTVTDNENPTASNPADINVQCLSDVPVPNPAVVTDEADNCSTPVVTFVSQTPDPGINDGTITRTYRVDDGNGNSIDVYQDIVINDTVVPVPDITNLPTISEECLAIVTAPTATDNCSGVITATTSDPLTYNTQGTFIITWTYNDGNGNSRTQTQTVIVDDITDPTANSPAPVNVQCSSDVPVPNINVVTGKNDNCSSSANITVAHVSDVSDGNSSPEIITRTYSVTDAAGNSINVIQTITVNDITNPSLTPISDRNENLVSNCDFSIPDYTGLTTANDNCTPTGSIIKTQSPVAGTTISGHDTTQLITITADDGNGNTIDTSFTITLKDITAPVLTPGADQTVNLDPSCSVVIPDVTGSATDNCTVNITQAPLAGTIVSLSHGATTTVTVTATDAAGLTDVETVVITANDATPPVLTAGANQNVNLDTNCFITIPDVRGTATDNCTYIITQSPAIGAQISTSHNLTTDVIVTVTDDNGNSDTTTVVLTAKDVTPPTISCPSDIVVNNDSGSCDAVVTWAALTVDDNCNYSISSTHNSGDTFPVGTTEVTYTITDDAGLSVQCSFDVTVVDNEPPLITLNGSGAIITIESCSDPYVEEGAVVSDNCSTGSVVIVGDDLVDVDTPGTYIVTYNYTDDNGNAANEVIRTIKVVDSTNPTVIGKPITLELDINGNASIAAPEDVDGGSFDDCGIASMTVSPNTFDCSNVGNNQVTLTVTDINGNVETKNTNVKVEDNIAPTVITQNITIQLDASGNASITAAQIDNGSSDACGILPLSVSPSTFTCAEVGSNTVTLTVTDNNSNVSTATATVVVEDDADPTITCPSNIIVNTDNGNCSAVVTWTAPVADDNCTYTVTSTHNSGDTFPLGTTTVTYTVTDASNNTAQCSFDVTVNDNEAPVITLTGSDTMILEACFDTYTELGATATDNCSVGAVTVGGDVVDVNTPGVYTVTYNVNDANGNSAVEETRTITVQDTTAPVADVTNLPDVIGECSASVIAPTATDNCAGSVTATTSDPTSYNAQGTYTITWTYSDSSGNTSSQTQTVIVDDVTLPTISAPSNVSISADVGQCSASGVNLGSPVVGDNCSGYVVTNDAVEPYAIGNTTVTWTITDVGGNIATATQIVTVTDDEDPILNCISDQNVSFDVNCEFVLPDYTAMASATDNCTNVTITQSPSIGTAITGTTTVTLTATDDAGNTTSCTFNVIPIDNTAPTANGKDITITLSALGVVNLDADDLDNGSVDACGIVLTTASPNSFNCGDVGPNTVTFTVYDDAGNSDSTTVTVTVEDTTPPTMLCKDAVIVIDPITRVATLSPSQVDNGVNDICGIASMTVSPTTFLEDPGGNLYTTTAVLTATDVNGNTNTCTVNVTVEPPRNDNTYLTGQVTNPVPDNVVPASALIDATACPGGLYDPKDVTLSLAPVGTYNLQASDVINWEYSTDNGENWTVIPGTANRLTYTVTNITNDTFIRLRLYDAGDPSTIRTSAEAYVRFLPPDEPPTIVSTTSLDICLGESVTANAESFFDGRIGQFGRGGQFNYAQPDGWRVDGLDGFFPASGNNTEEPTWKESNGATNRTFSNIAYDTSDNTKFAMANGVNNSTTLETPVFSTVGMLASEALLTFYTGYYFCGGGNGLIELSFDAGNSYTVVLTTEQGDTFASGTNTGEYLVDPNNKCQSNKLYPDVGPFRYTSIDLGPYVGNSSLRVRFSFEGSSAWCEDVPFTNASCGTHYFDVASGWAIDDVGFPYVQVEDELEWTDEQGNVIAIGSSATVTPTIPGQRTYGVTSLINDCRADNDDGTEFLDIGASLAYAGEDYTPLASQCGESFIQLGAYDNTITALENYNNDAYRTNLYQIPANASENYAGTGVTGTWSIVSTSVSSPCGNPGTFSDANDPNATFTGTPGIYTLRWTLNDANACSDDVTVEITECTVIDFDGVNDYVTFKNNYNLNSQFSIEAWVKPNSVSGTSTIFSRKDATDNSNGYDLCVVNGQVQFNWYYGSGSGSVTSGTNDIDTSRWHHIAVTFNGTQYKLYVDGIEFGSVNNTNPPAQSGNNIEAILGAMDQGPPDDPTRYFHGWIDELRIWNIGISERHIRQMMNQEIDENGIDVFGEVIPRRIYGPDVSPQDGNEDFAITWSNLEGYYRMNLACGDLAPFKNGVAGRLRNITTSQQETAPLPYYSRINGQTWDTDNAWVNWDVNDVPNSLGIDGTTYIDWNIVQLDHSFSSGNRDIVLLGLIQNSGELTMAEPSQPLDEKNWGQSLWVSKYLQLNGSIDLVGYSQLVQKRYGESTPFVGTTNFTTDQTEESELLESSTGFIERDEQGRLSSFIYNYWSSPVSLQGAANNADYNISQVLLDGTISANPKSGINYQYPHWSSDGPLTSPITLTTYWMWKFNGTGGDYDSWQWIGHTGMLEVGDGYTMKGTTGSTSDPTFTQNYVFKGKPHNGSFTRSILAGNNRLLGNPYPSAMSADEFIKDNVSVAEGGRRTTNIINGTLYFWHHFTIVNHNLREYIGGYATYNLTGGVQAISSDYRIDANNDEGTVWPKIFIPVGQGFFVNTLNDQYSDHAGGSGEIQFNNSQRFFWRRPDIESSFGSVFFKSNSSKKAMRSIRPEIGVDNRTKVRLDFRSPQGYLRGLLLGADPNATLGFDIAYDGAIADEIREDMYWLLEDGKYIIQGVPEIREGQEFPIGFTIKEAGEVTIGLDTIQNNLNELEVYVMDKELNETFNISEEPYILNLDIGEHHERFSIVFEPLLKPVDEIGLEMGIKVYMDNEQSLLKLEKIVDTEIKEVVLYNSIGKIEDSWNKNLGKPKLEFPVHTATGVYFVQVQTSDGIKNAKIIIE